MNSAFTAKFCPAKFGWDNALMLNCLQWVHETQMPWCAKMSGTVAEADRLSFEFTSYAYLVTDVMLPAGEYTEPFDLALVEEFRQVFTSYSANELNHSVSSIRLDSAVKCAVGRLRMCLWCQFRDPTEQLVLAFSPAKFGWHIAYRLNCLQWALESDRASVSYASFHDRLIVPSTGTEFEADWLTRFSSREVWRVVRKIGDVRNTAEAAEFMAAFPLVEGDRSTGISQGIAHLRLNLYALPRFTAFAMAKHHRLGAGSGLAVLGEDVCRMILGWCFE